MQEDPGLAQEVGLSAEKVTSFLLPLARGNGVGAGRAAAGLSWGAGVERALREEGAPLFLFLCLVVGEAWPLESDRLGSARNQLQLVRSLIPSFQPRCTHL